MGRSWKRSAVLMTLTLVMAATALVAQTTYYVRTTGNDGNDGLTVATAKLTIQAAVNAAVANDIVDVGPGTYAENVSIAKGLTLRSTDGAASTIIDGSNASSLLGTIVITGTVADLTIGDVANGFTILGIDGTPGLEKSAIYLQGGNKDNITIRGNVITARGDAALMCEYNADVDGLVIDQNTIDGATFNGAHPAGDGFGAQFTLANVPRQLVVLSGGAGVTNTKNITFTDNEINGTAGGTSITDNTGAAAAPHPQGNTLVTIDVAGTNTITGNVFSGTSARYASALRTRGGGTITITGNTFNGSYPSNFEANAGQSARAADVFDDNTFSAAAYASGTIAIPTSISGAIALAGSGATVDVKAGTYAEDLTITKSVSLRGPNYGVSPNTGSRVAEAVIHPATDYVWGENIIVNADDVTIDGFTLDGDNPLLISGYTNTTAADIDAAEAVTAYYGGTDRLKVRNNIIKNYFYSCVSLYPYYGGAGIPSSGHEVIENRIEDIGTYDNTTGAEYWGLGVLLYNNAYAAVEDNVMSNVRVGIQTGNFYSATPDAGFAHGIRNNTITARRRGIFHNLHYSAASELPVEDNTITGLDNSNEAQWDGLLLSSLSVPASASGNIIDVGSVTNPSQGIEVWNVKSTYPVVISGGSVTGTDIGLFLNNYEGYASDASDGAHATVSGLDITLSSGGAGIVLRDNNASTHANVHLTIGSGVTVSGGFLGLSVENASARVLSMDDPAFSGQGLTYIRLASNSFNIDATGATFDGVSGATATLSENYDIEDMIVHKIDNAALGFVRVKAAEVFVTTNSFIAPATTTPSIQRGIDAASSGNTLNIRAGNYGRQVATGRWVNGVNGPHQFGLFVDKPLAIIGSGAGDSPVTQATDAAVVFETNAMNNFGYSGIFVDADNVSMHGLKILDNYTNAGAVNNNKTIEVDGDNFSIDDCWLTQSTFGSLYFGAWVSGTINTYTIADNQFDNAIVSINNGIGLSGPRTQRQITGNVFNGTQTGIPYAIGFRGWNGASPAQGWITSPVGGAVVTGNTFNQNMENLIWARGNVGGYIEDQIDWNEIWTNNTFNTRKVVALSDYPSFDPRTYLDAGGYPASRRIGTVIQSSVNLAQNGDVILAGPGSYAEQVLVDRTLDIRGANYGVDPNTAARGTESIMQLSGSTQRAFTISAGNTNVSVDGFRFDQGSPIHDGNYTFAPRTSDVTFRHNLVENSNNIFAGTSTSWRDVVISNNRFIAVNGTPTSSAMLINSLLSASVTDNTFIDMNYSAILVDNVPTATVSRNVIDGAGFQAIQLANAMGNATVSENVINDANRSSGNADRGAIRLYGSAFTGTVVVRNNTITGGYTGIAVRNLENITGKDITVTENSITGLDGGKAIYHGGTGTLSAPCNWYDVSTGAGVTAQITGDVAYMPFLTNGTDDEAGTLGFQPVPLSCNGYFERVVVYADQDATSPLGVYATIQEGIDNSVDGNDVRIHAGTYAEDPIVYHDVTFRAIENTQPLLATGRYFILGETGLGSGTFVDLNAADLGTFGVNANGTINDAVENVNDGGLVKLTRTAEYGFASEIFTQNVVLGDKAVTLRGEGTTGSACGVAPEIAIDGGSGIVLTSSGAANKVIENVTLKIASSAAARFAQVGNGASAGNITARNMRFYVGTAQILGLQQLTKPTALADGEDIPEYIDDGNDPAFGSGKFIYEEGAPFDASTLLAAWKGNDANPASIENVYDYSTGNTNLAQTTAKNRPTRVDDATYFNNNDAILFGTGDRVLTGKSKAEIVTGTEKTVFVVFRTSPAGNNDRIIYKHGDANYGLSIGYADDENVQFNIYSDRGVALATHQWPVDPNTTVIAQLYFDGSSTDHRVGVSLDYADGVTEEHLEAFSDATDFSATTLAGPANYGTAAGINLGGLHGETFFDGGKITTKSPKNTFVNGAIGEVMILNTADKAVRDEVYCYLHTKYNLGDNENGLERIPVEIVGEDVPAGDDRPAVWPNPAATVATVSFDVPEQQLVTVTVVDLMGRAVAHLASEEMSDGRAMIEFPTADLPNGVYSVLVSGASFTVSVPFVVQQ